MDAATLLVLADAWYPAPWPRLKSLAPAPTIEMSVMFRAPLPLPDSLVLGQVPQPARARRILRRAGRVVDAGRDAGRAVATARAADPGYYLSSRDIRVT